MRKALHTAVLALCLAGCGSGETASPDLSFVPPDDLAIGRLRDGIPIDLNRSAPPPYDLAWSACGGTPLAGTCAEKFFESFVACFAPAGSCRVANHNFGPDACWENGASFHTSGGGTQYRFYAMGKTACLSSKTIYGNPTAVQFCAGGDTSCGAVDDAGVPSGGALYQPETGIFTCPDGTQVDVGPNLGGCSVLNTLLSPASLCPSTNFGSCPW
jgi:hypothetical protein